MEMVRRGVMEAKACIITGLSLKKPTQMLWPKASRRTTVRARRTESRILTNMACLALSGLPAPNSFETLVLLLKVISFVMKCEGEVMEKKE